MSTEQPREGWKGIKDKRVAGPGLEIGLDLRMEELAWPLLDEELLRAAAVAAVLVDYRQRARKQRGHSGLQGTGANWRMLRRWAQLDGQR